MEKKRQVAQKIANSLMPLSEESVEMLASILICTNLKKYELFLKEGEICTQIGYVEKGMVRQYYYKNQKELTEYFAYEGKMFISLESCFLCEPSRMIIEALENTIVFGLLYSQLVELSKENQEFADFHRRILEESLVISQRKMDSLRLETASERYHRLMRESPEIIKRAPLTDIASFLLMTPETLSRVRANM